MCPSSHELLYDSEASLRLVDAALREFQPAMVTRLLAESRAELRTLLGCLRSHRFAASADPLPASWVAILDETEHRLATMIQSLEAVGPPVAGDPGTVADER